MNTKKTIKIVPFIVILIVLGGCLLFSLDNNALNINEINTSVLSLNTEYLNIVEQYISKDKNFVISFVVREQGNKNVFGDIVFSDINKNIHTVIGIFNTSLDNFYSTIHVEDSKLFFTETIRLGGNDVHSEEKIIDLSNYIH